VTPCPARYKAGRGAASPIAPGFRSKKMAKGMNRKTLILVASAMLLLDFAGRVQAQQHQTDNEIRFFQWKVARDPDDQFNYDRLGVAYIQKARETGDVTYYNLAAKSLEKSLALESKAPEAAPPTKHLATVYYAEHRFAEALALAQQALALNPRDITPYALIGDAHCEMGDYSQAWADYARLASPTDPQSAAKLALSGTQYLDQSRESVKSLLTGETRAAVEHMQTAVKMSVDAGMAAESIAWSQFSLGEAYLQLGDLVGAKAAYEDALKTYPNYHRALAGLAKVSAAEGHLAEAIDLYKQAIAVIPLPAYAAALGDVYAKAGNSTEAKKNYDLVEYIARLNAFNQSVYNRELASFMLTMMSIWRRRLHWRGKSLRSGTTSIPGMRLPGRSTRTPSHRRRPRPSRKLCILIPRTRYSCFTPA
jgi:tetratricopeptide (TPR) repeat protein